MKAANHSVTHPDYSLEWKHEKKNKQPFDLKARVVDTIIKFVNDAGAGIIDLLQLVSHVCQVIFMAGRIYLDALTPFILTGRSGTIGV